MSEQVKQAPVPVTENSLTAKQFTLNVLNGMAIGIVAALIANAAIGGLLTLFTETSKVAQGLKFVATVIQFATAPLIGFLVGVNFKFNPFQAACLSLVAYVAAGNVQFVPAQTFTILVDGVEQTKTIAAGFAVKGLGDILNVLVATSLAAGATLLIKNKFGSLTLLLQPIVVGVGVGYIGYFLAPYVGLVTTYLGDLIKYFTELQPYIMCPLLAITFCFAVSSPLSSVALALVTGVDGLSSGAANIGVASAATFLIIASFKANKIGVPIAIFFGTIKMMLPKLIMRPYLFVPMFILAAVNGLAVAVLGIVGDNASAGFGYISLIGPLKAYALMDSPAKLLYIVLAYLVIPFVVGYAIHFVCTRILKLYNNDYFKFES
ncbi:PTS sugar transporter subunit IIC [Psittacicella gerlachiana]|uniref:Phosphotransferase system EIIC domain-containing protein n=1 Tax=Psittacicella gerlachiana TaxID=2028574 RepID=A0A3A1YCP0_9GAMM|nr:PTS sugar transporter subunit IIC [Psittacicella gerlachiana]RIY34930.1 hypothetical protein CKF59_04465 [Psittacicella gerlachiana]